MNICLCQWRVSETSCECLAYVSCHTFVHIAFKLVASNEILLTSIASALYVVFVNRDSFTFSRRAISDMYPCVVGCELNLIFIDMFN